MKHFESLKNFTEVRQLIKDYKVHLKIKLILLKYCFCFRIHRTKRKLKWLATGEKF